MSFPVADMRPLRLSRLSFSSPLRAAAVVLIALATGAGDCTTGTGPADGGDGDGDPEAEWTQAFDTAPIGSVSGVWGSGPDDVFVVGGNELTGAVFHYNGTEWAPMTVPGGTNLLVWVYGWGPNDVVAVGVGGSVIRYNGSEWTALDSGTTEDLWGVFGFSGEDVWIVGGDVNTNDPLILRLQNDTFTPYPVAPEENPNGVYSLFKIWGVGNKLFAVGQLGLILEWTGSAWVRNPAGADADEDFVSLWGTGEDNIVVAGGRGNARIAHYNGSGWSTIAPSGVGGLNAVTMMDSGHALLGGVWGTIAVYDVATQELSYEDIDTQGDVHAIWGDGAGRYYAVGGTFLAPHRGFAFVRTVGSD